jgi:hypothetical protein
MGAPIKEVTMPTGISAGEIIVLASVSDSNKKIEPSKIVHGILYLLSFPINSLEILGTISPTKEIIPAMETADAASNEETAMEIF